MMGLNRRNVLRAAFLVATAASAARPGEWGQTVDVRHEDELCVRYQARLDGPFLVVRAAVGPGWHTFAMDNKQRAEEKLAGKAPISIDRATEIVPAGLETVGPWYQSEPKDFSRPQLRWFSWGFDHEALFVAKVRYSGAAAAHLTLRGQACTETICKNIDVAIPLALPGAKIAANSSDIDLKTLVQVR